MILRDFTGLLAGHKGTVQRVEDEYVMVALDPRTPEEARAISKAWQLPIVQTFGGEYGGVELLAFETRKHPAVDPEVTRKATIK